MAEKKKKFIWKSGEAIESETYEPLGNVRDRGAIHLDAAMPSDEDLQRAKIEEKILSQKNVPYSKTITERKAPQNDKEILIEESESGLKNIDKDDARKVLDNEPRKIRGIDRFGKK